MHDNRPSTSADHPAYGFDHCECEQRYDSGSVANSNEFGNSALGRRLLPKKAPLIPPCSVELTHGNLRRRVLPPDRLPMTSSMLFWFFIFGFCLLPSQAGFFSSKSVPIREYDDNGIGTVSFSPQHSGKKIQLQKLVYDENTNRLIVGAVDHLYDVQTSLTDIKETVQIGSDDCEFTSCESHIKAMAIDPEEHALIECSTAGNGRCRKRILGNISHVIEESGHGLVPWTMAGHSSALITQTLRNNITTKTLILGGAAYEENSPTNVNLIAGFNIESGRNFSVLKYTFEGFYLVLKSSPQPQSDIVFGIEFVKMFEDSKYVYMLMKNLADGGSKLARFCRGDPSFYSYSEVPLKCYAPDGTLLPFVQDAFIGQPQYNLANEFGQTIDSVELIYAVFASKFAADSEGPSRSGLCIFNMKVVEEQFHEAQRRCNKGYGKRGFEYYGDMNKECGANSLTDLDCGTQVNPHVNGVDSPVNGTSGLVQEGEFFTSIFIHGAHDADVAFVGTATGSMHKILLTNTTHAKIFKILQLTRDNSSVLQDKVFVRRAPQPPTLYVATQYAIIKVQVNHCEKVEKCDDCIRQGNPFCGWCLKSNTCSGDCSADITDKPFINYRGLHSCPSITSITPDVQHIAVSRNLSIGVQNIADSAGLECVFEIENVQQRKRAEVADGKLRCATPTFKSLLSAGVVRPEVNSVSAKLKITDRNATLITTTFTFFDCQQHKTCSSCANSEFPCNWCLQNSKCVANPEDSCRRDTIVVSRVSEGASFQGPEDCPRIDTKNHSDFYIGYGKDRPINMSAHNMVGNFMKHLYCVFSYNNQILRVRARHNNHIECIDTKFDSFENLASMAPTAAIDMAVCWGKNDTPGLIPSNQGSRCLDNPHNIKVIVYQCERLANNCGDCLTLPSQYECGWCEYTNQCTFRSTCDRDWLSILSPNVRCKNPQIVDFSPKKGPVNGGTRVNITGFNLGLSASNVQVLIANKRCQIDSSEYRATKSITCVTSPVDRAQDGHVVVVINGDTTSTDYANASLTTFKFADPKIDNFMPFRGPVSGGTDIRIEGRSLDSGGDVVVNIDRVKCPVLKREEDYLVCRTEAAPHAGYQGNIALHVDGATFSFSKKISFEFLPDPVINRVNNTVSIVSGGIQVDVHGRDFDLLQRPRMGLRYEDQVTFGEVCEHIEKSHMICRTPPVNLKSRTAISTEQPLDLRFGFSLDGEPDSFVEYAPGSFSDSPWIRVYPDPVIVHFGKIQVAQPGADIVLKGENLALATSVRDVNVTIGGIPCPVTALASVTLTCQLGPEVERLFDSDDDLNVLVSMGNMVENVGMVTGDTGFASSSFVIFAVITAIISLLFVLILFVLYRHKNSSHNRELRSLKHQMTSIEMKVAQECKEAFHELQTNLNAIACSLPEGTSFIPFLSYDEYTARILFPHNFNNHPVLHELEVDQERAAQVESGLRQLHHLVQNRTFLLSFVKTIDENKYLLQKDRVYVGSLLMVILQERMDYCTDILKQLLKDLIKRNLEARFQPKILFRRAESVAERMLSVWFSFLMYRYLTGTAGEQLYQFYWATKQQTEKGPQDAISLEARYSLSEEKLLRSTVQYRELIVFVVSETSDILNDVQVTVLDCDSITQVKEKCIDACYRSLPHSNRPLPSDVDLELRPATGGRKLLLDLDQTSRHDGNCWQYNTLAHYKIENKGVFALVPRQGNCSSYNLSLMSDRSDKSSSSFHNSPTPTRPFGTHPNNGHSKETVRFFHLVKQQSESDQPEKMMSEIYLTRLLHMKGTLQRFIENLFEVIFSTNNHNIRLPACVKYMFDFLDDQAYEHGIIDEDVVHAWKSNALPLRFWVNLIKNPDFIFDISKPTKIEGSLNVVAQTLMDACSTQELHLTKDSPSSKLLFANDMDKYKTLVHEFYDNISKLPRIPEADMNSFLLQESKLRKRNSLVYSSALNELYIYVAQNRDMIFEELSRNEFALHDELPEHFKTMLETMDIVPDTTLINNGSLDNYNSKSRLMSNSNSRYF